MPDLGRWSGIDQLAESYLSTSTYAYVANNPVSQFDVDGRWFNDDGNIGQAPPTWGLHDSQYKPLLSFSTYDGMHTNEGAGVQYTPFGKTGAYIDLMTALQNRQKFSLTTRNGYMSWWTDGDEPEYRGIVNGEIEIGAQEIIIHKMKLYERDQFLDGFTKRLGPLGFANDVKIQLFEAGIRRSAGLTINEFNALNKTAQELRTLGALGYTGSKYLSVFKNLGVAASIVTTAYSASKVYNQYKEGGASEVFSHRDVVDATVGAIGLGTTALVAVGLVSNPVGWAIGIGVLAYGTGTMIYDLTQQP
ncbi:RHS repeat-associated core domain-containing protein [Chryseobacterium sp. IT-36CA2]